jgi:thiol-disulfide isomerase/thioredoxin
MSTRALIGLFLAGTAGIIIFLFVHMSGGPGKPSIELGTKKAAACTHGEHDCLPEVSYVDTTGKAYNAQSLAGKVVVVNFWATWCHPCQKEIPDLSRLYDKYKDQGVVFLGIMSDNPDPQTFLNFSSDYEMTYPVIRSNSDLMVSYNYPEALPTTFVFDRGGKQRFLPGEKGPHVGAIRADPFEQLLSQLVAEK